MSTCVIYSTILLLLLSLGSTKCFSFESTSKKLDQLLTSAKLSRHVRNSETPTWIWQEYEFGTGVGNREELVVVNISVHTHPDLPNDGTKWQYLKAHYREYLAFARESIFTLYELDPQNNTVGNPITLNIEDRILMFKLITLHVDNIEVIEDIVAIFCVESNRGTELKWYRFVENNFTMFWSWPVQKYVSDIEYIRHGNQSKLLLLDGGENNYFKKQYSLIDVYAFTIDFEKGSQFWLCQRMVVPKTFGIQVCPIHESIMLALRGLDNVLLYEYKNDMSTACHLFRTFQELPSHILKNFICFDSGYIQYIATSGDEAGLFEFLENEFQYSTMSEEFFNQVADISWVKNVRLNTYRDEVLLLVQLKNSTVLALSWAGAGFNKTILPNQILDQFDLSQVTVIPRFGFVSGNKFVRIDTKLRNLPRPIQDEVTRMVNMEALLQEVLNAQDDALNRTEVRYNQSYHAKGAITGFWNLSTVDVENVTINDENVVYHTVTVDSYNLTNEELRSNLTFYKEKLKDLDERLNEIEMNLQNNVFANVTNIKLRTIDVSGNFSVGGTLKVKNLTLNSINGITKEHINEFIYNDDEIIKGKKIFPTIKYQEIQIKFFNNIPTTNIVFTPVKKDYHDIDFSKIKTLVVDKHLDFSVINGIDWEKLINGIVWKNRASVIPGETIVEGEIVGDIVKVDNLNGLTYPDDYVLNNHKVTTNLTGFKTFTTLTVANISGIKSINGIPIEDFVILSNQEVLNNEITFENLTIEGNLQVNKNIISNLNVSYQRLLNESNDILSDMIFSNLRVLGKIILKDSINGQTWSDFDDLLLKTDNEAEITGKKTFLSDVTLGLNTKIESKRINGHHIEQFVTTDTAQVFKNLERISANISIGQVTYGKVKQLEENLKKKSGKDKCLKDIVTLLEPIIVDDLEFTTLNENIYFNDFRKKMKERFRNVSFDHLSIRTLTTEDLIPEVINGLDYADFEKRRMTISSSQNITGKCTIGDLNADTLIAERINNMSIQELNDIESLYYGIINGNISIDSLNVTEYISVSSINGKRIQDISNPDTLGDVIFEKDVYVENLTVLGLVNGMNLSEYFSDAVLKTDTDIVVTGRKVFEKINCNYLETTLLNGHPVENILDPEKEQVLEEVTVIDGTVSVLREFDTAGKINEVVFHDITNRFKYLGDNTFQLNGDFLFNEDTFIKNLNVDGFIQKTHLDDFTENVIFKNDSNVTVSGAKIFQGPVKFDEPFVIDENLNDLDLKKFYDEVVFINKPFEVKTNIVFKEDIFVEKNLIIEENLETSNIADVDLYELSSNVVNVRKPSFIPSTVTFTDVVFDSGIKTEKINDIDINLLIPLHTDQRISRLQGNNITVKNAHISYINNNILNSIYEDTFMLYGDQNITGNISFQNGVHARSNFDAHLINNISPSQIIDLNANDTLTGDFVFEDPVTMNNNLRVLKYINGLDINAWQQVAITTNSPGKQMVSGKWKVHGNVTFEKRVDGNGFLNKINVTDLADTLEKQKLETNALVRDIRMDLNSMCEDINTVRSYMKNQIYKFNAFEYVETLEFNGTITSLHHIELPNVGDYLFVNYETCHLDVFMYTGSEFVRGSTIPNFAFINQWINFERENILYILTVGKQACGKSPGNLWKLENDEFMHILNLGNVTDAKKVNEKTFLILVDNKLEKWSISDINRPSKIKTINLEENMKFIWDSSRILLTDQFSIYEYDPNELNRTIWSKLPDYKNVLSFKTGIFEKEMFLCYGEKAANKYIFIYDNDLLQKNIIQTIRIRKAASPLIMNFEGFIETLLIFIEDNKYIQIYEYKGIQGFVYKDTLKMEADKLLKFQVLKHPKLAKKQYLALIRGNQLILLEAKMYGEKLIMEELSCSLH